MKNLYLISIVAASLLALSCAKPEDNTKKEEDVKEQQTETEEDDGQIYVLGIGNSGAKFKFVSIIYDK